MGTVVLTLFGEEIIPEQMNAVGRPAKPKKVKATPAPAEEDAPYPEATQENTVSDEVAPTDLEAEPSADTQTETTTEKPVTKKSWPL